MVKLKEILMQWTCLEFKRLSVIKDINNELVLRDSMHFKAQNFQPTINFICCKTSQIFNIQPLAINPC